MLLFLLLGNHVSEKPYDKNPYQNHVQHSTELNWKLEAQALNTEISFFSPT